MADGSTSPRRENTVGLRQIVAALCFGVVGWLVMTVSWHPSASNRAYTGTPEFRVYTVGIIILWAVSPVVWSLGLTSIRQLGKLPWPLFRRTAPYLTLTVVLALVLVWLSFQLAGIHHHGQQAGKFRTLATYTLALIAATPSFVAMWLTFNTIPEMDPLDERSAPAQVKSRVSGLLAARSAMLASLTGVGALVSIGVLVTGAQRLAVLADPGARASYPASYVLIWGVSFTAILVVNFAPAYQRLLSAARGTVDQVLPLLTPPTSNWQARAADRTTLGGILQVTAGVKDAVNSIVVIAGPLLASIVSLLLPSAG